MYRSVSRKNMKIMFSNGTKQYNAKYNIFLPLLGLVSITREEVVTHFAHSQISSFRLGANVSFIVCYKLYCKLQCYKAGWEQTKLGYCLVKITLPTSFPGTKRCRSVYHEYCYEKRVKFSKNLTLVILLVV